MNESLERRTQEGIPPSLEQVELPDNFGLIRRAITDEKKHIDGFEDVLFGEALGAGAGGFFNTMGPPTQLVFALSIVPNTSVTEIIKEHVKSTPREIVQELRKIGPLSGMKIIDLGCGWPTFALAAGTLGAEVYTADDGYLSPEIRAKLTGHTEIDLNDPNALAVLQKATGSDFDLVTEWIIGKTELNRSDLEVPNKQTILHIGEGLLKKGGYLYSLKVGGGIKPYRKK